MGSGGEGDIWTDGDHPSCLLPVDGSAARDDRENRQVVLSADGLCTEDHPSAVEEIGVPPDHEVARVLFGHSALPPVDLSRLEGLPSAIREVSSEDGPMRSSEAPCRSRRAARAAMASSSSKPFAASTRRI